jgi:primosomal protein N' (replication factor Y) (superfamily II helicase)
MKPPILRIAVSTPLYRYFDYLAPHDCNPAALHAGQRVRVPFGRRTTVGVLLEVVEHTDVATGKLKHALQILDDQAVIAPDVQAMVNWASRYYQYPIGEAFAAALPALLRQGQPAAIQQTRGWRLTVAGAALTPETLVRAPRQAAVIAALRAAPEGLDRSALDAPASVLQALSDKGWIESFSADNSLAALAVPDIPHTLNPDQQRAVDRVAAHLDGFHAFLLEGVTGSGKTEVYLHLIGQLLTRGLQVLVLVPEIGLTPQLVTRFRQRFPVALAVLHSGLSDRERLNAWLAARDGHAPIVLGTRSAIFTPLTRPGLLIVDEEHDPSLKQQEGFRYSARDLAVWRARQLGVPVLLGSATPSLESLYNVEQQRYQHLLLPERTGRAELPEFRLIDVRQQPLQDGLTPLLLKEIERHLAARGQVLLFLNRRGFAPTLMCYDCDWVAECRRCDARLTWHQSDGRLHCHHCGSQRPVDTRCPQCGGHDLHPQGQGTERVEQALAGHFPDVEMLRIDRDTTRRKGALDRLLEQARDGEHQILLGTQMLAKGHHFPNVTLVGILDADHGLFSTDFRASERMAQLIVQVAGRAGREDRPGQVVIQTAHPDHPLLATLVTRGYPAFAAAALEERKAAHLPPLTNLALLRAEATEAGAPLHFLEGVRERIRQHGGGGVEAWGPIPASMERRAGRYRAQLLLQSDQRADLQQLLGGLVRELEQSPETRRVRWSVDVDPADTY